MRLKWWHVPPGLWLAVVIVGVLFAVPASLAAEAEARDYDANDCHTMGFVCFVLGEYEEGLKWCERGLAIEPERYPGITEKRRRFGGWRGTRRRWRPAFYSRNPADSRRRNRFYLTSAWRFYNLK